MSNKMYTLKDFELSLELDAVERASEFQKYINQLNEFGCKKLISYSNCFNLPIVINESSLNSWSFSIWNSYGNLVFIFILFKINI